MKVDLREGLILTLSLAMSASCSLKTYELGDEYRKVAKFENVRIELEDQLTVPWEEKEIVWEYLRTRFVEDKKFVTSLDPQFVSYFNEEKFCDTYFDTEAMKFFRDKTVVRLRKRVNLTNHQDRKNGRVLLQMKVSGISENKLERAELKYRVQAKYYEAIRDRGNISLDVVEPEDRERVRSDFQKSGVSVADLKNVFTLVDYRKRIYLLKDQKPFMSISLDHVKVDYNNDSVRFVEIEPELNEKMFTKADSATREYMKSVVAKVVGDIRQKFPTIRRDLTPKYRRVIGLLEKGPSSFKKDFPTGGKRI